MFAKNGPNPNDKGKTRAILVTQSHGSSLKDSRAADYWQRTFIEGAIC